MLTVQDFLLSHRPNDELILPTAKKSDGTGLLAEAAEQTWFLFGGKSTAKTSLLLSLGIRFARCGHSVVFIGKQSRTKTTWSEAMSAAAEDETVASRIQLKYISEEERLNFYLASVHQIKPRLLVIDEFSSYFSEQARHVDPQHHLREQQARLMYTLALLQSATEFSLGNSLAAVTGGSQAVPVPMTVVVSDTVNSLDLHPFMHIYSRLAKHYFHVASEQGSQNIYRLEGPLPFSALPQLSEKQDKKERDHQAMAMQTDSNNNSNNAQSSNSAMRTETKEDSNKKVKALPTGLPGRFRFVPEREFVIMGLNDGRAVADDLKNS